MQGSVIKGAQSFREKTDFGCLEGVYKGPVTLIGSSLLTRDPLTLQIVLERPAGYFLAALTTSLALAVPRQLIEKYPGNGYPRAWTRHLADNGSFGGNLYKLVKVTGAERDAETSMLVFERNERFWGQKPHLRCIEYTVLRSGDGAWANFTAGKGDLSQPPLEYLGGSSRLKDTVIQQTPLLSISWLQPNWHIAPFDDLPVRQAFSLALDRRAIAKVATTVFPPPTFKDVPLPSIHCLPDGMPGYNPLLTDATRRSDKDALTPDLTTARALISSYAAEKCGGQLEQCPPINLAYPSSQSLDLVSSEIVVQWQAAFPHWRISSTGCVRGCEVLYANPQSIQLLSEGWVADYPDPQDYLSLLWSTHGVYNHSFVSIPAVDALCAQADAISDQAGRIQLYQQAEQLLVNQGAAIPLFQLEAVYVVRTQVVNWRVAPTGQTPLSVWQATYISR
jgi:oligopeptide transport system substrate-binding protein